MLAPADRNRLLSLMGVPLYVQRTGPQATPVEVAEPPATTALPATPQLRPVARQTQAVNQVAGSHRLGLVAAGPVPPGLTRDFLQVLGQKNLLQAPVAWPDYAVLLGEVTQVPASVITVKAPLLLPDARAKRAVWRQLRPLLAELRRS